MHSSLRTLSLVLTILGAPLSAQAGSVVLPTGGAVGDGNTSTPLLLAYKAGRLQVLVDGRVLARNVATIQQVAARADARFQATYPARLFPSMSVWLSHSASTPASMSKTFAKNRGPQRRLMFSGSFTAPAQGPSQHPFHLVWKFQTPFLYLRKNGALLIEWEAPGRGQEPPYYSMDAHRTAAGTGSSWTFGSPGSTGAKDLLLVGADHGKLRSPGAAEIRIWGSTVPLPAIAAFGISNRSHGPLALPLDLGPLGATGNALRVSLDLLLPMQVVSNAPWSAKSILPIPKDPGLEGASLFAQVLVVDPAANALGLVFSQGLGMQIARSHAEMAMTGHLDSSSPDGHFVQHDTGVVLKLNGLFQ